MPTISTRAARVKVYPLDTAGVPSEANSSFINATNVTVGVEASEIDVTHFETGGFAAFLPSYVGATVAVDGFYNSANRPFADANNVGPLIMAGNWVKIEVYSNRPTNNLAPDIAAVIGGGATERFTFPKAYVLVANMGLVVRDAARISFTARNDGPFTYPGNFTFTGLA